MNDIHQLAAQLAPLLGTCAKLAQTFDTNEPDERAKRKLDEIRRAIEGVWATLAEFAIKENFDGASVDNAHPGYVIRDNVLVPFYLLHDLPGNPELMELTALGLSLRLTKDGVICLSGSAALLGTLKFIGDVDYCEYALPGKYSSSDIVASANEHAARNASPLCERIKVVSPEWSQNCATWDSTTPMTLKRLLDEKGAYQLKLDFITDIQAVGAVEATNMALLLAAGREDEIMRASFAAQEVPIPGAVLPRPLCDALQLGRYINFLIKQIQDYAQKNPVKALKRGLSLARILMLPQWDDDLIACLQDPRAALTAAHEARSQLLAKLSSTTDASAPRTLTRKALCRSLERTIAELDNKMAISPGAQPTTQAAESQWAAESALVLSAFINDVRGAIAAA